MESAETATGTTFGRRLVAVMGTGRNGSTLLARLLDGSPDLWLYPIELLWLQDRHWFEEDGGAWWSGFQLDELKQTHLDQLVEPIDESGDPRALFAPDRERSPEASLVAYLAAVEEAYAPAPRGSRVLLFKSTEAGDARRYAELFPGLRQIHIVRDPVATYASFKRTNLNKGATFWQLGDELEVLIDGRFVPHARYLLDACAAEPDRHLLVRYEDLCADPERVIGAICSWLGVRPPGDAGAVTVLGGRRLLRYSGKPSKAGLDAPDRVVADMARAFGYDEIVAPRERDLIRLRTNPLAARLGYAPEPPGSGGLRLALSWLAPDVRERAHVTSWARFAKAYAERRTYVVRTILAGAAR